MSQPDNEVYFYYKYDLKRFWLDHGLNIIKRRNGPCHPNFERAYTRPAPQVHAKESAVN